MQKIIHNMHIVTTLYLLIFIMIMSFIILQVFYVNRVSDLASDMELERVSNATARISEVSNTYIHQIELCGREIIYNSVFCSFADETNPSAWVGARYTMEGILRMVKLVNEGIVNILYTDMEDIIIGYNRDGEFQAIQKIRTQSKWRTVSNNSKGIHLRIGDEYVYITAPYRSKTGSRFYGILFYNMDDLQNRAELLGEDSFISITIFNEDGTPVFPGRNISNITQQAYQLAMTIPTDEQCTTRISGGVVSTYRMSGTGFVIVSVIASASNTTDNLAIFAVYSTIFISLFLVLFGILLRQIIVAPLRKLLDYLHTTSSQPMAPHAQLVVPYKNEIGELTGAMNMMLNSIETMNLRVKESQDKLYAMRLDKKRMELAAILSQINPHFLYNTLDCIRSIALMIESDEIVSITTAMAKIMRYSLKGPSIVRVEEEINCIRDYLHIIQIRHMNRFQINLDIAPEMLNKRIPKMILQPIVENAVFHGIEQKRFGGSLIMHGRLQGEMLLFEIIDDGQGIHPDVLASIRAAIESELAGEGYLLSDKQSIGLLNIAARLQLLFPKNFKLEIDSAVDSGTRVVLTIPVNKTPSSIS